METLRLSVKENDIEKAGEIIRNGGLVAFPTETVYGLGANALDADAVKSIYQAKGRPSDNPMIVHIASIEELDNLADEISEAAKLLMSNFWPGPITFVLKKKSIVPDVTTGGLDTVAVRMPSNEVARELIAKARRPIAAPSANISGRPSPTTAIDVVEDMDGRIDAVVMGDDCAVGIESTVLDCTGDKPVVLRPGFVTPEMIGEILGEDVSYDKHLLTEPAEVLNPEDGAKELDEFKPKSPGMKYKHYAPKAKVQIVHHNADALKAKAIDDGLKAEVLDYRENSEEAAHSFFADLRELDRRGTELILVCALPESGLGFAIMNRMLKSAGYDVID